MKKILLSLVLAMIFFVSLTNAQVTTYNYDFICLDSADGVTFWGISNEIEQDVKAVKFTLTSNGISIINEVDLPDTLNLFTIIAINENGFIFKSGQNLTSYINGVINYRHINGLVDIKKSSNNGIYYLVSTPENVSVYKTNSDFSGENWVTTTYDIMHVSDFGIGESMVYIGGYQIGENGYTAIIVSGQFNETPYQYPFTQYTNIKKVYTDGDVAFCMAINENNYPPGYFVLRCNSQSVGHDVILNIPTPSGTVPFLCKKNEFLYINMCYQVQKMNLISGIYQIIFPVLPPNRITSMFIAGNKLVVLLLSGFSIYEISEEVSINDSISSPPVELDSYPNPFRTETTISFDLKKSEHVSLQIYNAKGQLIKTLINEIRSSGNNEITWNGTDENGEKVSTGIYLYRMTNGKYTTSKKIILLK